MLSLRAEGLSRSFGDRTAVRSLSFRVAAGEVVGFLGPNGAGKTTTFNLLSGLLVADAGKLFLDDQPIAIGGRDLRARMGVVFQHPSLDVKMTGRENLAMGGALYGLRGRTLNDRISWGLDLVELRDRAGELVEHYSGGMRRRLELARVLLHRPEIVLMDEPTQGLDVAASRRIWSQLLELRRREKLTILLTTHSPDEAEHCDRIIVLDRGEVIAEGEPSQLRAQVGGDVVVITCTEPIGLRDGLLERFGVDARPLSEVSETGGHETGTVVFEHPSAHELVPRIIEAFPNGRVRGIHMRQASIGDVFLKLTGKTIDGADAAHAHARELSERASRAKRSS